MKKNRIAQGWLWHSCSLELLCKIVSSWSSDTPKVAQVSTLVNSKQSFVAPYCEPLMSFFSSWHVSEDFIFKQKSLEMKSHYGHTINLSVSARGCMSGEVDYEALPEGASTGATLIAGWVKTWRPSRFSINLSQGLSGCGWTLHYVSCGRGKDENASPCLQHTQVPKQVCCQKHPVHDERRRLLATCPGGSGHGTRGRTSSCHVFLVLRNNEGKACSQIQAGNTI